jgi:hypothetical protein
MAAVLILSQIIVGVGDLNAAAVRFRSMGFDVLDGGVHPGVGTANRVIPLGAQYIELLGVISADQARQNAYGRSLLRATVDGDRLVRWSLRTDGIEGVADRLGIRVERRRRERPDGEVLTWRAAGLDLALADATLPFFMQWDRPEQYPGLMSAAHANGARGVTHLTVTPRDIDRFDTWIADADVPLRIVDRLLPGLWSIGVATNEGEFIISG